MSLMRRRMIMQQTEENDSFTGTLVQGHYNNASYDDIRVHAEGEQKFGIGRKLEFSVPEPYELYAGVPSSTLKVVTGQSGAWTNSVVIRQQSYAEDTTVKYEGVFNTSFGILFKKNDDSPITAEEVKRVFKVKEV